MLRITFVALAASALLASFAIALLLRSTLISKLLIVASAIVGGLAAVAAAASIGESLLRFWALLFSVASVGCALGGGARLFLRSARWIHRFVIYSGYAVVFAAMSAAALYLSARNPSGKLAILLLVLVYAAGSLAIFLAKSFTVRVAARKMPEYSAAVNSRAGYAGQKYW